MVGSAQGPPERKSWAVAYDIIPRFVLWMCADNVCLNNILWRIPNFIHYYQMRYHLQGSRNRNEFYYIKCSVAKVS